MTLRHIVVGLDGSDDSRHALTWAVDLARDLGAEVVAVHAMGLLDRLGDAPPVATAPHRAEIVTAFEQSWTAPLVSSGVAARRIIRDGPAVDVVHGVSEEIGADLVVVGSRGIGGSTAPTLGSTSHRLALESRCPVVVIPPRRPAEVAPGRTRG